MPQKIFLLTSVSALVFSLEGFSSQREDDPYNHHPQRTTSSINGNATFYSKNREDRNGFEGTSTDPKERFSRDKKSQKDKDRIGRKPQEPKQPYTFHERYPAEWDSYSIRELFDLYPRGILPKMQEEVNNFLNVMKACFTDKNFTEISCARVLYMLGSWSEHKEYILAYFDQYPDWLKGWHATTLGKIQKFDSQALSNSLYAFALLGVQPGKDFLEAWQKNAIKTVKTFKSQALANSLYAFALLNQSIPPFLIQQFKKKMDSEVFLMKELHALFLVKQYLRMKNEKFVEFSSSLQGKINEALQEKKKKRIKEAPLKMRWNLP